MTAIVRLCAIAALAVAVGAGALGATPVDAVVLASLAGIPAWLRQDDSAERRRRRREFAFVVVFAIAAAGFVVVSSTIALGIPIAVVEVALGAVYVLAWLMALRFLRAIVVAPLRRCRVPAPVRTLVAVVALLGVGLPLLFVSLQIHRPKFSLPMPDDVDVARGTAIAFASRDGTRLVGTLFADGVERPGVVFCHGVGAARAQVAAHAALATAAGCHVLLFDFRAHGESAGRTTTFGAREREDVIAAVAALRDSARVTGVALVGVSMGGASALLAAPEVDVAGVFAECAFAELRGMTATRFALLPSVVADLLTNAAALAARVQPGIDIDTVSPRDALAAFDPRRPVTLLHAGADVVVPVAEGHRLAASRAAPMLHVFAGAAHGDCLGADPERYRSLLREFVTACFGQIPPR